MQTITVLNRNYLGEAEGSLLEATSVPGIYRIQGTAKFVGSTYARQQEVEITQSVATLSVQVVQEDVNLQFSANDFINMMSRTGEYSASMQSRFSTEELAAIDAVQAHVRGLTINVGDKYRYYTRSTNRWDLATFEMTGTDIGRVVSGFAIKSPSLKTAKRKLLTALNAVYGLMLTADEIKASANN